MSMVMVVQFLRMIMNFPVACMMTETMQHVFCKGPCEPTGQQQACLEHDGCIRTDQNKYNQGRDDHGQEYDNASCMLHEFFIPEYHKGIVSHITAFKGLIIGVWIARPGIGCRLTGLLNTRTRFICNSVSISLTKPGKILSRDKKKRFRSPGMICPFLFSIPSIAIFATSSGFIADQRPNQGPVRFCRIRMGVVFMAPGQIVLTKTFSFFSSRPRLFEKARRYDLVPPYTCF